MLAKTGNWIYAGKSSDVTQYYYNGDWRHATDIYKRLSSEKIKTLETRKMPGKHKYLYVLDDSIRERIEKLRKSYPESMRQ